MKFHSKHTSNIKNSNKINGMMPLFLASSLFFSLFFASNVQAFDKVEVDLYERGANGNNGDDNASLHMVETVKVWQSVKKLKDLLYLSDMGGDDLKNHEIVNNLYSIIHNLDSEVELDDILKGVDNEKIYLKAVKYLNSVNPSYAALLDSYYNYDLYDLPLQTKYIKKNSKTKNDDSVNYFVINDKVYEKADDVFYLKSHEINSAQSLIDLYKQNVLDKEDLIIGTNENAPLTVFYGCNSLENIEEFDEFNNNLWVEAQGGKIQYVWKYSCDINKDIQDDKYSFTEKRFTDISFVKDDLENYKIGNDTVEIFFDEEQKGDVDLKLTDSIIKFHEYGDYYFEISENDDEDDVQSFFENNNHKKNIWQTLNFTKNVLSKLPLKSIQDKYVLLNHPYQLMKGDVTYSAHGTIIEDLISLMNLGVNYDLIGCFVNGVNIKLTDLSMSKLISSIHRELKFMKFFKKLSNKYDFQLTIEKMKNIVTDFSAMSQNYVRNSQPRKFDISDSIETDSEIIIFANDLESDPQYDSLSKDIREFITEKESKFGEIPEYAENWNEVVFITDFENELIVSGLARALEVIKQGYPQRIGILPIPSTSGSDKENEKFIKIVSQLQKIGQCQPDLLANFLNNGEGLKFDEDLEILESTDEAVETIFELAEKMGFQENSILVNGEIFPFRENTWNYFIATVTKKDIGLLKSNLPSALRSWKEGEGSIRTLLHSESQPFIERDLVLTPNFYGDATYTTEDLNGLNELKKAGLILEFSTSTTYNVVHTLSIVDDFESILAWENLANLLDLPLYGIKIRLIHNGVNNKNWNKLQKIIEKAKDKLNKSDLMKNLPKGNYFMDKVSNLDFSNWLLDLSKHQLSSPRFFVINGRFIDLQSHDRYMKPISSGKFYNLLKFDSMRSLQTIRVLETALNVDEISPEVVEEFSSLLSKMYYDDMLVNKGIDYSGEPILSRIPLKKIMNKKEVAKSNSLVLHNTSKKRPIDLVLIVDLMEERSQHLVSHIAQLADTNFHKFVNLQIVLLPTKKVRFASIQRLFLDPQESHSEYLSIDEETGLANIDADNVELNLKYPRPNLTPDGTEVWCSVHLQSSKHEVSRMSVESDFSNVCIKVVDSENTEVTRFQTMQTFGFGQFKLPINDTSSVYHFETCSPEENIIIDGFSLDVRNDFTPWKSFTVKDFIDGFAFIKASKIEKNTLPLKHDAETLNIVVTIENEDDKHQFFQLYDLVLSTYDSKKVQFWVWNQEFHGLHNIQEEFSNLENVHLVSYRWPKWLRPTKLAVNQLNLSKFMFLDMILPSNMVKVVYVDLEQLNDSFLDTFVLNTEALENAIDAKGFTIGMEPYGEDEHGYWEQGYWEEFLTNNKLNFFKANNFIVNLKNYREKSFGDLLRVHYQQISTDIFSLRNFGQDLINNIQVKAKIHSLVDSDLDETKIDEIIHDEL